MTFMDLIIYGSITRGKELLACFRSVLQSKFNTLLFTLRSVCSIISVFLSSEHFIMHTTHFN